MSSTPNYSLNLKIKLLDNNSKEIFIWDQSIAKDAYLTRKGNEILTRENHSEINQNEETILFHIQKSHKTNSFQIVNVIPKNNKFQTIKSIQNLDIKLWTNLNKENTYENNQKGEYILSENDIIRLGNLKYLVHKINTPPKKNNEDRDAIFLPIPKIDDYYEARLCNCYELCLCVCEKKKFLHYHCFKKHFSKQPKENEQKTVKSYYLDKFYCKECNCTYPFVFTVGENTSLNILDYDIPKNENYIILESLGHKDEDNGIKKSVHLISLTNKPIKIGKKENNDLIINDNSIEDEHAEIIFDEKNKQVILKNLNDNDTDVLLRKRLILNEEKIHLRTKNAKIEVNWISN